MVGGVVGSAPAQREKEDLGIMGRRIGWLSCEVLSAPPVNRMLPQWCDATQ